MNIKGPRKYVAAARVFAETLGIDNFNLRIKKVKPNKYSGWINRTRKGYRINTDSIRTLAHEIVHLKQYLKHELVESGDLIFWIGKPTMLTDDLNDENYWLAPHEMEARAMEDYLLHKLAVK